MTSTRRVSKKGLALLVGVMVTHRPSWPPSTGVSGDSDGLRVSGRVSGSAKSAPSSSPKILEMSPGCERGPLSVRPADVAGWLPLAGPDVYSPLPGVMLPPLGPFPSLLFFSPCLDDDPAEPSGEVPTPLTTDFP